MRHQQRQLSQQSKDPIAWAPSEIYGAGSDYCLHAVMLGGVCVVCVWCGVAMMIWCDGVCMCAHIVSLVCVVKHGIYMFMCVFVCTDSTVGVGLCMCMYVYGLLDVHTQSELLPAYPSSTEESYFFTQRLGCPLFLPLL